MRAKLAKEDFWKLKALNQEARAIGAEEQLLQARYESLQQRKQELEKKWKEALEKAARRAKAGGTFGQWRVNLQSDNPEEGWIEYPDPPAGKKKKGGEG